MKTGFIHIQVNENFTNGDSWYTCVAMDISYRHYVYLRKNFRHYHRVAGDTKIVVMANFEITSKQASNIVHAYVRGAFKLEDTGDFD